MDQCYEVGRKEENGFLFNDAHNTFLLWLYGAGLWFFYVHDPRQDSTYHSLLHQSWGTGWNKK